MSTSSRFATIAFALTALTSPAYAAGVEDIIRLCSQPDSQMSGGQVAFCHAFWQGMGDALKHAATSGAATPAAPSTPAPSSRTPSAATPSIAKPTASLRPREIPLDQGPVREIPIGQGPAREIPIAQGRAREIPIDQDPSR